MVTPNPHQSSGRLPSLACFRSPLLSKVGRHPRGVILSKIMSLAELWSTSRAQLEKKQDEPADSDEEWI